MKRHASLIIAFGLLAASNVGAQDFNKGGRTAFQFVKIGMGARQAALGEACIADVQEVNAAFWNPANISAIVSTEASFSYARWFADMDLFAGAAGFRWQGVGVFALSYAGLDYGDIQEALVFGSSGSSDTRTGSTFSGSDLLLGLSYARTFTDRLALGISVKFLQEKLFQYSESIFAFDVGTSYDLGYKGLRLAMSAQNFSAGSARWLAEGQGDRQEGYDLPLLFRIGTSFALIGNENAFLRVGDSHHVQLSVDAINSNDYDERLHLGAEYLFNDFIALRGGHRFNYEDGNWSIGFGLHPRLSNISMRVDYAYVSHEFLDSPHRLTVSFAF